MTPIFSKLTGCILNIASVATLGTWDAGHLEEGARAWTADVRDVWVLAKNTLAGTAADGITVVAATGAGASAFWIRQSEGDMYWSYQGTWSVDPAAGVDTNTGASPAQAIKTVAELSRRLVQVRQNSNFTVNVLNDVPNTDSFVDRRRIVGGATSNSAYGSVITFQGQRTVTASITLAAGTQQTLPTRAAATAQAEAVLGAGSWVAGDVGKLIVDGSGNTAFVLSEKAAGATARVTDWIASNDTYAAAPAEGAASVTTLTRWRAPVAVGGNGVSAQPAVAYALSFRDLDFDDVGNNVRPFVNQGAVCFFSRCRISNANGGTVLRFFAAGSTGFCQLTGCLVHNTSPISLASFVLGDIRAAGLSLFWTFGNGFRSAILTLSSSPNRMFGGCVQNGYIEGGSAAGFHAGPDHSLGASTTGAWVGVYNDFNTFATALPGAIAVNAGARIRIEGSVYGTQVGTSSAGGVSGLASRNGGLMWLPSAMDLVTATSCFNLVPTGAGTAFYLDGLASTTGSITAANGGAVLPISIVCTTWAQYIGGVANGWARNMRNPANNGGFYQGI